MYAILRVDLQTLAAAVVVHKLIDACRAIAGLGAGKFGPVDADRNAGIFECQVRGLLFGVVGVADKHARESIKSDFAIGLGIINRLAFCSGLKVGMVGLGAAKRPRDIAFEQKLLQSIHDRTCQQPTLFEPRLKVARLVQLRVQACFVPPVLGNVPNTDPATLAAQLQAQGQEHPAFARWLARNVHAHQNPQLRAVTLSFKRVGQAPGDANADQLDALATLVDDYSAGEARVTHECWGAQNWVCHRAPVTTQLQIRD